MSVPVSSRAVRKRRTRAGMAGRGTWGVLVTLQVGEHDDLGKGSEHVSTGGSELTRQVVARCCSSGRGQSFGDGQRTKKTLVKRSTADLQKEGVNLSGE